MRLLVLTEDAPAAVIAVLRRPFISLPETALVRVADALVPLVPVPRVLP
jgi:hypothetical protein